MLNQVPDPSLIVEFDRLVAELEASISQESDAGRKVNVALDLLGILSRVLSSVSNVSDLVDKLSQ